MIRKNIDLFRIYTLGVLLLTHVCALVGQNSNQKYESLSDQLNKSSDISEIFQLLLEIGDIFEFTDQQKALGYYYEAQSISKNQNQDDPKWIENQGLSERYIGLVYYYQSDYDTALSYFFSSLKHYQKVKNHQQISASYNNIGMVQHVMRNLSTAAEYYLQSKKHAELASDSVGIARALVNLGVTYQRNDDFDTSLRYYKKALPIFQAKESHKEYASTFNNIGSLYALKAKQETQRDSLILFYEKALLNYYQAKDILFEIQDTPALATSLGNIAQIYLFQSQLHEMDTAVANTNRNRAIEYGNQSMEVSEELNDLLNIIFAAYSVYEAHKYLGNTEEAFSYLEKINTTQVKLYEENMARATTEMEIKYQSEQKQQEIERQNILAQRRIIINIALVIFVILLMVLLITMYINFANKRKSNKIVEEKNQMLLHANTEIQAQRDEIEKQHNLVVKQKRQTEFVYQQLTDSMHYAQNIHDSLFPKKESFEQYFSEQAIIFKPKEIVSGDFYWFFENKDECIIAVADCTGHGVPGSMMALLGSILLNQTVVEKKETDLPQIIKKLAEGFVGVLSSAQKEHDPIEGMEIALCKYNRTTKKLQFSGAKGLIWIDTGSEIKSIKGSNISLSAKLKPSLHHLNFELHEQTLSKNDTIFLFTDGYIDQMNDNNKRIGSKMLKKLIIDNRKSKLSHLHNIVEDHLLSHQGNEAQIDDITWLALRL